MPAFDVCAKIVRDCCTEILEMAETGEWREIPQLEMRDLFGFDGLGSAWPALARLKRLAEEGQLTPVQLREVAELEELAARTKPIMEKILLGYRDLVRRGLVPRQ
ncbi:MAG: hypothetical protein AB1645_10215 [Bacillota bacterium]